MFRFAALAAAVTACDAIYGLEQTVIPAVPCASASLPVAQQFDPALASVTDLALGSTPDHGSVMATVAGVTRLALVKLDGDAWVLDRDADSTLPSGQQLVGRVVGDGDVYATVNTLRTELDQYARGARYNLQLPSVDLDPVFDLDVGNEVTTIDPVDGPVFRRVVLTKRPTEDGQNATVVFVDRQAPFTSTSWTENPRRLTEILSDPSLVDIDRAVVTGDSQTLVYAAKYGGDASFDIYASPFDADRGVFPRGEKLPFVDTGEDETAPSIDAECTTLVFRRGRDELMVKP